MLVILCFVIVLCYELRMLVILCLSLFYISVYEY